jgi:hypothetical protein
MSWWLVLVGSWFPWEHQGKSFKPNFAIFFLICTMTPLFSWSHHERAANVNVNIGNILLHL